MKNMKTAAGMLCLAGILSLGMGTTVFAEDGDSHYPVTITTYNYPPMKESLVECQ